MKETVAEKHGSLSCTNKIESKNKELHIIIEVNNSTL